MSAKRGMNKGKNKDDEDFNPSKKILSFVRDMRLEDRAISEAMAASSIDM